MALLAGEILFLTRRAMKENGINSILVIISYFSSISITALYTLPKYPGFLPHYLIPYSLCLLILSAFFIHLIWKKNKLISMILGLNLIILMISSFFLPGNLYYFISGHLNESDNARNISKIIFEDLSQHQDSSRNSFILLVDDLYYSTGPYWYFLEILNQKQLIRLISSTNNIQPIVTNPKYIYIICSEDNVSKTFQGFCFDRAVKEIRRMNILDDPILIHIYQNMSYKYFFIYRIDSY